MTDSIILLGWGYQEIIICAVVFMLLFGSAKLPTLMRSMGRSINEFKAGMNDKPASTPPGIDEAGEE